MGNKVTHHSEQEVIAVLTQAKELGAKVEALLDDETSNKRPASAEERKLYAEVADTFKVIATKYGVMKAIRFPKKVQFI